MSRLCRLQPAGPACIFPFLLKNGLVCGAVVDAQGAQNQYFCKLNLEPAPDPRPHSYFWAVDNGRESLSFPDTTVDTAKEGWPWTGRQGLNCSMGGRGQGK